MAVEDLIEPVDDWVLVEREGSPDMHGGLVLPETARIDRSVRARILKTGPSAHPAFRPGRTVLCEPRGGVLIQAVKGGGEVVLLSPSSGDVGAFLLEAGG